MRKTKKYTVHSIEKKNEIVKEYLENGHPAYLVRKYDICARQTLYKWVKQYQQYGTTVDNRGKFSVGKRKHTRRKKIIVEDMTRDELIEYVNAVEDIKKLMVCLKQQKINIK